MLGKIPGIWLFSIYFEKVTYMVKRLHKLIIIHRGEISKMHLISNKKKQSKTKKKQLWSHGLKLENQEMKQELMLQENHAESQAKQKVGNGGKKTAITSVCGKNKTK